LTLGSLTKAVCALQRAESLAEPALGPLRCRQWGPNPRTHCSSLTCGSAIGLPYELISRNVLTEDDFATPQIKADVEGLVKMYEMRGSMANRFGTVVRRSDGKIGDRFEREEMRPLHRAIVAALLDPIPLEIGKKEDTQGWGIATSDNALIYLHQLDGSGRVAVQYGRMVELTVAGLTIGEEHSQIHAPSELHAPFLGPDPDPEYLNALYAELTAGTAQSRRLGRAIEWLDLAWRNTTSIDDDTRIVAIYNGFEVLLDKEGALEIGERLAALLEPGAANTTRPIPKLRQGDRATFQPRDVTDLEWWFVFFAFLRHDITHGAEISPRQYEWNDKAHLFLGESRLRQAIKQTVANAGSRDRAARPVRADHSQVRKADPRGRRHRIARRRQRGPSRPGPLAIPHRIDGLVRADAAQIHLGRSDARVPERVSHDVERRARADEVDGECVA
jgi:hypothetical protein